MVNGVMFTNFAIVNGGAQAPQAPQALFVAKSVGQAAPSPPTSLISSNCKW